jgi:hypothetical protein
MIACIRFVIPALLRLLMPDSVTAQPCCLRASALLSVLAHQPRDVELLRQVKS